MAARPLQFYCFQATDQRSSPPETPVVRKLKGLCKVSGDLSHLNDGKLNLSMGARR